MPVPRKCRVLIWRQPSFACLQFGRDLVHVFTGATLFQEVNGGAEPERRRQLGTPSSLSRYSDRLSHLRFWLLDAADDASVGALPVLLPAYSGT